MSGISTYTSEDTIFRGDFGLANEVWAGEYNLATYHYTNDRKYNLSRLDYGNNDRVEYTYGGKDRLTQETFVDGDTVTYAYKKTGDGSVS